MLIPVKLSAIIATDMIDEVYDNSVLINCVATELYFGILNLNTTLGCYFDWVDIVNVTGGF